MNYLCLVKSFQLIICFFILFFYRGSAQIPSYFTIGAEELYNTDVYTLYYDDNTDVLHVGTNRGIYRYTQNKFIPLLHNKDAVGNSFFQLKTDNRNNLYCCNLAGQIFKIENNQLKLFYQIQSSKPILDFRYYFDNENNLIINTQQIIRKVTSKDDSILLDIQTFKKTTKRAPRIESSTQLSDGSIYFGLYTHLYYYKYFNNQLVRLNYPKSIKNLKTVNFFKLNDIVYFNYEDTIKRIDGKPLKSIAILENNSSIYQRNFDEIIVRSTKNGCYFLKQEDNNLIKRPIILNNKFISTATQNKNNTTFLGTFKNGIIVIPNTNIIKQKTTSYYTGITVSENNTVFLSDKEGRIFKGNDKLELYSRHLHNVDHLFYLRASYNLEKTVLDSILHKKNIPLSTTVDLSNIKDLEEYENEKVFLISPDKIQFITLDTTEIISPEFAKKIDSSLYKFNLASRGKSITFIKENKQLYYSTNLNIYTKKWNNSITKTILFNEEKILGNTLTNYNRQLIVGSEKNGILFYKNNVFQNRITTKQGLKSNTILKLKIVKDILFILSNKGIQLYNLKIHKFIGIGEREGLISNKIIDFSLSKDKLWLLDKDGYYSIALEYILKSRKITLGDIYLDSILVNDKKINHSNTFSFDYNKKKFEFFFDYRDIETKSEAQFNYKLEGSSNEWKAIKTNINKIEFPALAPGEYTFKLNLSYRKQSTSTIEYNFTISSPFWLQLWFIISAFLLTILLISFFFVYRLRKFDKKRKIESEKQKMQTAIFESKLKAIRSQMNPHFIFNSLNSIQALVLKQESKKSYDYIEMFSDLVRKTLTFSEKSYIPISDEVDFLSIYLNLETLRMKKDFVFDIKNKSQEDILIPSLLIQPFIENAIHHGLLHKEGVKRLEIIFELKGKKASCTVIDNGIGRLKSHEINERQKYKHNSFSLIAMKERLNILSEQNNENYDYIVEDLYSSQKKSIGTKVIVFFPYKHQF